MNGRPLTIRLREFRLRFYQVSGAVKRQLLNRRTFLAAMWILRFVAWVLKWIKQDAE